MLIKFLFKDENLKILKDALPEISSVPILSDIQSFSSVCILHVYLETEVLLLLFIYSLLDILSYFNFPGKPIVN